MAKVKELFDAYRDVDDEKLFANLKYFLERIMPVCNEYDIKWPFTRTTRHGVSSVFRESSLIKKTFCA